MFEVVEGLDVCLAWLDPLNHEPVDHEPVDHEPVWFSRFRRGMQRHIDVVRLLTEYVRNFHFSASNPSLQKTRDISGLEQPRVQAWAPHRGRWVLALAGIAFATLALRHAGVCVERSDCMLTALSGRWHQSSLSLVEPSIQSQGSFH